MPRHSAQPKVPINEVYSKALHIMKNEHDHSLHTAFEGCYKNVAANQDAARFKELLRLLLDRRVEEVRAVNRLKKIMRQGSIRTKVPVFERDGSAVAWEKR